MALIRDSTLRAGGYVVICRGGTPWPPQAALQRWGGHGVPPLQIRFVTIESLSDG